MDSKARRAPPATTIIRRYGAVKRGGVSMKGPVSRLSTESLVQTNGETIDKKERAPFAQELAPKFASCRHVQPKTQSPQISP